MTGFLTEIETQVTAIAGYLGTAAVSALAIFAVVVGVRYVIRIVKGVK